MPPKASHSNPLQNSPFDEINKTINNAIPIEVPANKKKPKAFNLESAAMLQQKDLPDRVWAIHGLLPSGLTILSAAPKLGKSWLAMSIAWNIAKGESFLEHFATHPGRVIYLDFEHSELTVRERLELLKPDQVFPENLYFVREEDMPSMAHDGMERLIETLDTYPDVRLVIVDTLHYFKTPNTGHQSWYDQDYQALKPLSKLAKERGIAILAVHHNNKNEQAVDPMNRMSGSTGLTGGTDTLWMLDRKRNSADAQLTITGRDVEDQTLNLKFQEGMFSLVDESEQRTLNQQENDWITLYQKTSQPITIQTWTKFQNLKEDTARQQLSRGHRKGLLLKEGRNAYTPAPHLLSHCHKVFETLSESDFQDVTDGYIELSQIEQMSPLPSYIEEGLTYA
ncbi:MAG: AAA family ATPase [Vampirovibrionales bacterium]|nr:AAA family ATPase [Vampirovibrionales bacterium]